MGRCIVHNAHLVAEIEIWHRWEACRFRSRSASWFDRAAAATVGAVNEAQETEARNSWRMLRDRLDKEAVGAKSSQEAVIRLSAAYARLGEEERQAVNAELLEWLKDDDEALRFDALAVIREHHITVAQPALDDLIRRLKADTRPGAPYERRKISEILTDLRSERP
jgi:hypothetical protein